MELSSPQIWGQVRKKRGPVAQIQPGLLGAARVQFIAVILHPKNLQLDVRLS